MEGEAGFHLDVGDGHQVWVRPWGEPGGHPVLFLHGGPGSGCNPSQQRLFDPARHRVAFVDQRGAGRSLPPRARHANTTAHLLADLERVREHLGVERWLVVGGSWGATLALAYAQAHPERVTGLVLRATFLGTRAELDWAFGTGLSTFHPVLFDELLAVLPPDERADPLPALWARILDTDPQVHVPAALAWFHVERALSELVPPRTSLPSPLDGPLPATPFMEAHYFQHGCFLPEGALLDGASRMGDLPGILVQARYDLLCPPVTAHRVAARWPGARVVTVEAAGHSATHPEVEAAVREAVAALTPG
ncbi:prolyl aminopeptidase [Rubellimicrobium roseum]|uniref:Proline iminopeptidase n=1 Tax=Rubellimicrobium roseum TaxID=687525 RepID=A0A5C4NFQ1_9RHOB|nr:prolyl aminopeptidase [Rubellimicrobium roseum]TNC72962.1 prolyl aminopeptidase [Rubellimicrobium roseum]